MKKFNYLAILISAVFVLLTVSQVVLAQSPPLFPPSSSTPRYAANQVIVKYKPGESPQDVYQRVEIRRNRSSTAFGRVQNSLQNFGAFVLGQSSAEESYNLILSQEQSLRIIDRSQIFDPSYSGGQGLFLYRADSSQTVEQLVNYFSSLPEVEYAKPNYIRKAMGVTPNDPKFSDQWSLAKVKISDSWDLTKGSDDVVVALVDSGLDYNHEDIAGINRIPGRNYVACEKFTDGACTPDADNNECCSGFVREPNSELMDLFGHGTHLAGLIGGVVNNGKGIAGMNWNIRILPVRVLNAYGEGEDSWILQGIAYAVIYARTNHVKMVLNLSFGGNGPCTGDYANILDEAEGQGIVVAMASGNVLSGGVDASAFTPANCGKGIVVAATGPSDSRPYYSNYGSVVDIAAPGGEAELSGDQRFCRNAICVLSTIPPSLGKGDYGLTQGTSMSTAFVSGAAALLLAKNSDLSPDQVKSILKDNVDQISMESGKSIGTGRLNVFKALSATQETPTNTPPEPTATLVPEATVTPGGPTVTSSPTPEPNSTPEPTNTPTITPSPTPVCQPTSSLGYKVVLKAIKDSQCVYSEYHTNYLQYGATQLNEEGVCRAVRRLGTCE